MEQSETKKKKSGCVSCLVVLLVFFLLIAGVVGFLVYRIVKEPFEPDDPQAMAASAPMSAEERFRFSAADATAQVKLDKGDIWSLILARAGDDFQDVINEELAPYSLTMSGCYIDLEEDGLRLDLELYYKNFRMVVKVPCDLEVSGRRMVLKPTELKLGVISLPVKKMLPNLRMEYDVDLPVISNVTGKSFVKDGILLTGDMDLTFRDMVTIDETFHKITLFNESMQNTVDFLQTETELEKALSRLEEDPGSAEELYRGLFTLAGPEKTAVYLDDRYGLTERFFPGIDFDSLGEELTTLEGSYGNELYVLKKFFKSVVNVYIDKSFLLSDGEFILKGEPFRAGAYSEGKFDELFEMLDPEPVFLVLVDVEDGYRRTTSSFYRMVDENQQFTQEVDMNKTYILGIVVFGVGGDPFLIYDTEVQGEAFYYSETVLIPLTREEAAAMQVPGKFGIWTG